MLKTINGDVCLNKSSNPLKHAKKPTCIHYKGIGNKCAKGKLVIHGFGESSCSLKKID